MYNEIKMLPLSIIYIYHVVHIQQKYELQILTLCYTLAQKKLELHQDLLSM